MFQILVQFCHCKTLTYLLAYLQTCQCVSVLVLSRQQLQVEQQRRLQSARWSASTWQTPSPPPPSTTTTPPPSSPHGSRLLRVFALLLPGLVRSAHCLPRGNSPSTSELPPHQHSALNHRSRILMHHHSGAPSVRSVRAARLIKRDTVLLGGNTTVWKNKQACERARQCSGVFED